MSRPLTIGLLTTSYPRSAEDSAGLFVRGFARARAGLGHRVEVLAPEPSTPSEPPRDEGVELRWVPYARPRSLARTFYGAGVPDNVRRDPLAWPGLLTFPAALWVATARRHRRWDALVSHWALPCALVAGAFRGRRPHLAVLHSADVHLLRRLPGRETVASKIAAGSSDLLFTSRSLRDEFLSWLPPVLRAEVAGRAHVSAMGVDEAPDLPRRAARARWGLSRFTVLSLGRLIPLKGLEDLARALAGEDVDLVIAGEGPERRRIERALGPRARLGGPVHGEAKAALLRAADMLCLPSRVEPAGRTEGAPTVALEAAAAGLPIVASAVGALPELFSHEQTALLVPPGDLAALRAAILRARDEPALRKKLARAARAIGRRHQWSEIAPHLDRLLRGDPDRQSSLQAGRAPQG